MFAIALAWVGSAATATVQQCFYRLQERGGPPRRGLAANFTYEQTGSAIRFAGTNFEITDNDVYASGHGIYLQYAESGIVARNVVNYGMDGYMLDSSSNIVFEENHFMGINLFSRGNAGGATYGGPASSYIWYSKNTVKFVFGGDQEIMTLDGGSSPYFGKVSLSNDGMKMTFPVAPKYDQWCSSPNRCQTVNTNWNGSAAYVLSGQGKGQLRVFAAGGIKQNRTWTLKTPFGGVGGGVPLGVDSVISVFEHREKCIYRDNSFEDGGPFQLYGGMYHAVIANNTAARTDGFIVEGLNHESKPGGFPHLIPCFFVEHVDNSVVEGNNYAGTASGGFALSGFYNGSSPYYTGPMATAVTYRGNLVDNGEWTVSGAVADVLIEGNSMLDSDGALVIRTPNQTSRLFARNNQGL